MENLVLIVEDSPTQALGLQAVMKAAGLQVICATDGLMGLRRASQLNPALIVCDVEMPGIDGFQVCEELRSNPETAHIPIIIFTRHDTVDAIAHGEKLGAVDFIPKDAFAVAVLMETIRQMGLIEEDPAPEP